MRAPRYEGRVCVVTGGASGLGEAMCLGFSAEGGKVAVVDLNEDAAARVADACEGEARAYACDVADVDQVAAVFAAIDSDLGPVDVLVNSAGIAARRPEVSERALQQIQASFGTGERDSMKATSTLDDETWDSVIKVHLYGTFHCSREALRRMEEHRRGAILNLGSVAALRGLPISPEYTAAKGAILALTKGMALEVAGAGIRVNAIAPGWIDTPMPADLDERLVPIILAQVPQGRMGTPDEVAALALHLCAEEAGFTTGQVVSPNGGLYT